MHVLIRGTTPGYRFATKSQGTISVSASSRWISLVGEDRRRTIILINVVLDSFAYYETAPQYFKEEASINFGTPEVRAIGGGKILTRDF